MSAQVVVLGTIRSDGTLELDGKVPIPPGRVQVTIQPTVQPSADDPFWRVLEEIWASRSRQGHAARSVEQIDAQMRSLREEWEDRQQSLEEIRDQDPTRSGRAGSGEGSIE